MKKQDWLKWILCVEVIVLIALEKSGVATVNTLANMIGSRICLLTFQLFLYLKGWGEQNTRGRKFCRILFVFIWVCLVLEILWHPTFSDLMHFGSWQ